MLIGGAKTGNSRVRSKVGASFLRFHIGPQHGIDARLIALLPPQPAQQVGVQPDGDGLLGLRQNDLRLLPKIRAGWMNLVVCRKSASNVFVRQRSQMLPIRVVFSQYFFEYAALSSVATTLVIGSNELCF